ncbi:sporulation initiation factor Spo0A C-terminal domain-containing protein [Roseburia hominis]
MEEAYKLVRKIGIRSHYVGFEYLVHCIYFVMTDRSYLRNVTGKLYVEVGKIYGVSGGSVEAAMRRMIWDYWNQHGDSILLKIAGQRLYNRPTAMELIAILADYLREHTGKSK